MAANPVTYQELRAAEAKLLVSLSAWETDLLFRLDDAVMAHRATKPKPKRRGKEAQLPPEAIPVKNTRGVMALLKGLAARKAKKPTAPEGGQQ